MSLTMYKYINLGLDLISLEENRSCTPKKPSMVAKMKNGRAKEYINILLEQDLARKRDKMMENSSQILQHLSITTCAYSLRNHFQGTSPFKVQVNFGIPVFEG
jgi:hypothetical protein